jgi:dihydroflavonol-4-reductase
MIFVTGGTGFLGSYLLQELVSKGKPVRALRRERKFPAYLPPAIADQIEWVEGDLLDITGLVENLSGCDQIIHAAALVSFDPADKKKLFKTNIEGTANIVNAALETGISDFVHVSSVGALGKTDGSKKIDEEKKWDGNKGQSNYGISKYYGELEVWRGMGEGLSPLIVNPVTLLGYGDWNQTSCALFRKAYEEFPWYPEGTNGFADVRDAARAIVALMDGGFRNERFIISSENLSYQEIFRSMAKGFGKKPASHKAGPFLTSLAWRMAKIKSAFTGEKSLVTRESVAIAGSRHDYDNSKLLRTLPEFRFRPVEDSIFEACSHYLLSGRLEA